MTNEKLETITCKLAAEWSEILMSGTIYETTPELRDALTRVSGYFLSEMTNEKTTGKEEPEYYLKFNESLEAAKEDSKILSSTPRINQYEQRLSPHEVSGYVHWFRRYLSGHANPKWVDGHLIALLGLLDEQVHVDREKLKRLVEIATYTNDCCNIHSSIATKNYLEHNDFIQQFKKEIGG